MRTRRNERASASEGAARSPRNGLMGSSAATEPLDRRSGTAASVQPSWVPPVVRAVTARSSQARPGQTICTPERRAPCSRGARRAPAAGWIPVQVLPNAQRAAQAGRCSRPSAAIEARGSEESGRWNDAGSSLECSRARTPRLDGSRSAALAAGIARKVARLRPLAVLKC